MSVVIDFALPPDLERRLRAAIPDLDHDAKETYAVELYRRDILSQHQLAQILGLDRFATDAVLKRHGVMIEMSPSEFAGEIAELRSVIQK